MAKYIQYGCGLSCPDGWVNYDASPRLRLERLPGLGALLHSSNKSLFPAGVLFGYVIKGLPEEDGAAQGAYCSHVLEHLDRESVTVALRNTWRLLSPGGVFRLVVPCIEWRARLMIEDITAGDKLAVDHFMTRSHLGSPLSENTLPQRVRRALGNSAHLWMYDYGLMKHLLEEAGFADIRRCELGDAEDPMFGLVEDPSRFEKDGHSELALEARRPS